MTAVSVAEPTSSEPLADAPIPTARHFVKTIFRFGVAQALSWVSGAILVVILPRFLGDVSYGKLGFGFALTTTYGLICDLGISFFITKAVARAPARAGEILSNALAVRIALSVVAALAVLATLAILDYDSTTEKVCLVLSVGMVMGGAANSLRGTLQGLHRMRTVAAAPVVSGFTYAGGSAAVLAVGVGVVGVAAVSVLAMALATALNFTALVRQVRWTLPSWRVSRYLILGGLPFLVTQAALVIYGQIDTLLLSLLTKDAVVGWYVAAVRIMSIPQFIPTILTIVLFPALSAAAARPESYNRILRGGVEVILLVSVPIAFGIGLLPDRAIHLLGYPAAFDHSIVPLALLALGTPLIALDMVIGYALLAGEQQKQWAAVGVAAAVLNIAMNLIAIPYAQHAFGNAAIAAAATTTVTEMFILALGIKLLPRGALDPQTYSYAARCLTAAAAMALVVTLLRDAPLVIPIALGGIVYGLASVALGTLATADLRLALRHLLDR